MTYFFKISLILALCLSSFAVVAKPDPNLIGNLDKRRNKLENLISTETDPKKRKDYIRMLYQTQEYYLTDKSRLEMVRENYPELVKQVEYYRELPEEVKEKRLEESVKNQMSKSSEIISDPGRAWEQSSKSQRLKICEDASNTCLQEGKLTSCKFVLLRCELIVSNHLYNQVREYVRAKAEK